MPGEYQASLIAGDNKLQTSFLIRKDPRTEATIEEARRLWSAVGRENLMIKVPATPAGLPAIETLIGEGINVEVNRELQESAILLAGMAIAILVLLWFSLRRLSDVAIVGATLVFSLLWMQGLIGWGIIAGSEFDLKIISRSQFSNLLPILILALGIDDSLHALHRYKEERRNGKPPEDAARVSLTRVGRAIMLTSFTTMAAFAANFTSDIPALRSFGLEAAFGVGSAFILTGLWAPIIRLDWDLWIRSEERRVGKECRSRWSPYH